MDIKVMVSFIRREAGNEIPKQVLLMTLISGLAHSSLLAIINYSATKLIANSFNYKFIFVYVIIYIIWLVTKKNALILTNHLAESIVFKVRKRVVNYLMNTELVHFEELGRAEIYARLTKDTNEISGSSSPIINGIQATVLVIFALIYLMFLNFIAFIVTFILLCLPIINYFVGLQRIEHQFTESNRLETDYFETINEITGGFKELKINQQKKYDIFSGKAQSLAQQLMNKKILTGAKLTNFFIFAVACFYFLLGLMVFIVPELDKSVFADVAKITSTILFIIMPLSDAVSSIDSVNKASVAVKNLIDLEEKLVVRTAGTKEEPVLCGLFDNFKKIQFQELEFAYYDDSGKKQFGIGPINFEVNRGEIIFIIGGNGSGKSTLIKLLTGLYKPVAGKILIDGEMEVNVGNLQEYREQFGVIFSDFFLFSELYGIADLDKNKVLNLIDKMQLSKKTSFKDKAFTNRNLSTGQRKRLAMISVMLEQKNIFVFDEWAADQDPEFRKYFYNELIHEFKQMGKTIIAITHDDHYFDKADKIYKMDYGTFSEYKIG